MTSHTDLPTDDFERAAARVVEWIARYLEHPERYPVLSRVAPGEVRASLPQCKIFYDEQSASPNRRASHQ